MYQSVVLRPYYPDQCAVLSERTEWGPFGGTESGEIVPRGGTTPYATYGEIWAWWGESRWRADGLNIAITNASLRVTW
jgi:hypothetical protein